MNNGLTGADILQLKDISNRLIHDRTQADVDYALTCESEGIYTVENLRGAYNISDRNRVGEAVNFIVDCLKSVGVFEASPNIIRQNWGVYDIVKPRDNQKVLESLTKLKQLLPYNKTLSVPDNLDGLTYQRANAVESIICDLYGVFTRLWDSWMYCNDGYMSDFDPFNRQDWDD